MKFFLLAAVTLLAGCLSADRGRIFIFHQSVNLERFAEVRQADEDLLTKSGYYIGRIDVLEIEHRGGDPRVSFRVMGVRERDER